MRRTNFIGAVDRTELGGPPARPAPAARAGRRAGRAPDVGPARRPGPTHQEFAAPGPPAGPAGPRSRAPARVHRDRGPGEPSRAAGSSAGPPAPRGAPATAGGITRRALAAGRQA